MAGPLGGQEENLRAGATHRRGRQVGCRRARTPAQEATHGRHGGACVLSQHASHLLDRDARSLQHCRRHRLVCRRGHVRPSLLPEEYSVCGHHIQRHTLGNASGPLGEGRPERHDDGWRHALQC